MDSQGQQDEQNSFQALKNKWAQQTAIIQQQPQQNIIVSPPPIPPKPASVSLNKEEVESKEEAEKRVSLLTQQFEKQKVDIMSPGNFSANSLPLTTNVTKKAPPPPPTYDDTDPFGVPDSESSDGDSDIEEEEDDEYINHEENVKEGDNNLIEQVQKAHLQYTKLEESRFIGAPGVRSHDVPSASENNELDTKNLFSSKKPPPPPPPSKMYHRSTNSIPMNRPEYNSQPSTIVDTTIASPPILPPRPIMPQLPPRPSQSTLARAHTIASGTHSTMLTANYNNKLPTMSSPASVYTDNSDLEDEGQMRNMALKRANTVSAKRAMSRSELLMTSSIYPDFTHATRNAPHVLSDQRPFSTGHKGPVYALAASKNLVITGSNLLRTWDVYTGTVVTTIMMDANNNVNNSQNNNDSSSGDRIRAIAVAPCRIPIDEGRYIWIARQDTILAVVDVRAGGHKIISKRNDVHMAPILFLLRYGNSEIWSIDDSGVLNVWDVVSADYHQQNPLLTAMPRRYHVTSHAVAATIYGSKLWMSSGRTLAAHAIPVAGSQLGSNDTKSQPPVRIPNDMGNITKLMTIPYHPYRIFASHDDGKISMWDTRTMERIQIITVSMYGICTMTSVGEYHVWAGYNTGMIYVYDTRPEKWAVLKIWKAHTGAVTQLVVDESSLLLDEIKGRLQVVSSDSNGFVGVWDGLLTEHWKGK